MNAWTRRAIFFAAAALAGCATSGSLPVEGPGYSPFAATGSDAANPCRVKGYYAFGGPCVSHVLPARGYTFSLPRYRNIDWRWVVSPNNGGGKTFAFSDATGNGDITGTVGGKPFPAYPSICGAKSCPGKAYLYVLANIRTAQQVNAPHSPMFATDRSGLPGKNCGIAFLQTQGWLPIGHSFAAASGNAVTMKLDVSFPNSGTLAMALICKP